jgi:hypothetical protein
MDKYPEIKIIRKTGNEKLHVNGIDLAGDLLSFWQWSASDIIGNAMRGVFAEYIVASALDKTSGNRTEWDAYDIESKEGIKIEVKSSAYLQSWTQKKLSRIQFDIRPTQGFDSQKNSYSSQLTRQSDVYVFCVLEEINQEAVDPLNMDQWSFYVLGTNQLNQAVGHQKTISLGRLKELNPINATYSELYKSIKRSSFN